MELFKYLELLWNDCSNLCHFSDYETDELVFVNQAMSRKFQLFEDFTGKKTAHVLENLVEPCDCTSKERANQGEDVEEIVFCSVLNTHLRAHTSILELCGRKLHMVKYFRTSSDEKMGVDFTFDEALTKCLEILTIPDKKESIQGLLELLGHFYSCEVAYVYQFDNTDEDITRSFSWTSPNNKSIVPPQNDKDRLHGFLEWIESDNDLINLETLSESEVEGSQEQVYFGRYHIKNITLNKLWNDDGSLMGIVGMNNRANPLFDDRLLKAISVFVVERFHELSASRSLKTLQETDLLTGFFNRTKYAEKLTAIHHNPPKSMGVLFVNLNGLRKTNEYLGFEVGDMHIKKTAAILKECFVGDFYRISGDEFVGFSPDCDKNDFENTVDHLHQRLKNEHHESTFSIGHSWANGRYSIGEQVKIADTVMVINKQEFYSNTFREDREVSNAILQDLFQAIAEDEFLVYLQPQIDLETEKVVGAEALIRRFDKKEQKMIFPDNFIPFYEKNSVIRHVDLFVVRKACLILLEWMHLEREIPISVNLSRVTLMEHGIVSTISNILDEYKVPHELIIIEVTERIGLVENEVASTLVDEFKRKGFKLSLDDFGCAYSNIITLATISVDEVKIDKSLVDNVLTNAKNSVIVKNMLAMCLELEGTHTLAEGIETEEQAEFLRSVKCQLGQGYLYSRPIPNEEFFKKYIKE